MCAALRHLRGRLTSAGVETLEGLLGRVHVGEPDLHVARPAAGSLRLATGTRWSLVALARGRVRVLGAALGPGDALLLRGRGPVPATADEPGTTALVARFALHGTGHRLLPLPDDVLVPADSEFCRLLVERLTDQVGTSTTGDVVSARLLDWLVTETVRDVFAAGSAQPLPDPVVAAALAAIHDDPADPWTVADLADRAGVSRAAFARRFRDAVGTPPLSYVRAHRLDLAEYALLTEPDATVAAVARRVGYANPFSFSAAFRRHRGVSPSEVRDRVGS